jgi:hypothetical protein
MIVENTLSKHRACARAACGARLTTGVSDRGSRPWTAMATAGRDPPGRPMGWRRGHRARPGLRVSPPAGADDRAQRAALMRPVAPPLGTACARRPGTRDSLAHHRH